MNIEINPPIKVGDKVYIPNRPFGSCNFLERYTKHTEGIVKSVKFEYNMQTKDIKWTFSIEGENANYVFGKWVCFSLEQLYESFREEIETLIPEEIRNYLWKS